MTGHKTIAISDELLAAISETAAAQGKTPEQVIDEAARRYLGRERLDRFARQNEKRASKLGITEADVPRLVKETRAR